MFFGDYTGIRPSGPNSESFAESLHYIQTHKVNVPGDVNRGKAVISPFKQRRIHDFEKETRGVETRGEAEQVTCDP